MANNPETTALSADTPVHPYCNTVILLPDPLFQKIANNYSALAGHPPHLSDYIILEWPLMNVDGISITPDDPVNVQDISPDHISPSAGITSLGLS